MPKYEIFDTASDSIMSEIDEDNNQAKDRYIVGIGYHAVPPPYTGNYMPPRADPSFAGLDDSVFKFKISETKTSVNENESISSKSSEEIREEPKTVRSSAPIIEDWESDSEDECEDKTLTEQEISSNDNLGNPQYRLQDQGIFDSGCSRHMTGNKSFLTKYQEIDDGFVTLEAVLKEGRYTVNHQKFSKMTHPHPKRNFVPTAVTTKSRHVLVNAAKQNSAASTSIVRPKVNIVAIRPNVNAKSSYFKPHFPKRRHFNQRSAAKTNTCSRKINTAKGKIVTTVGPKAVVNAAEGKKETAIKTSTVPKESSDVNTSDQPGDVNVGDQPGDVNAGDQPGDVNAGDIQGDVEEILRNDHVCQGNEIRIDSCTNAASTSFNTASNISAVGSLTINTADFNQTNMPTLEATGRFDGAFDDRDLDVWTLVDLPYGKRAIGSKWVFRNKLDERGIVIRNKVRLVAQRNTQEEGINYDEVFAPVPRIEAIRLFLAYASFKDFIVYQMDVKSAFLYGTIEEEMSSMGELNFFLGLQVKKKQDGIFISQDKYVAEILKKFSKDCKHTNGNFKATAER
nr:copia protein [Tanacetum cinerariifolium]